MEPILNSDFDLIQRYAGDDYEGAKHEQLKRIYQKLEHLCVEICKLGFEYEIRKDPRKQNGPGRFVFQEYQWARLYPKGFRTPMSDRFAYIVGFSEGLNFHMMGLKSYQNTSASLKASRASWTNVDVEGESYKSLAQAFKEFDGRFRPLLWQTGTALGIEACRIQLNKLAMESYTKLLSSKKQIILQGPPGTGKTRMAKDLAELIICSSELPTNDKNKQVEILESEKYRDQFKLVQFHPSYSYEDFVRGITAYSEDGQVAYKTVNKVFAEFCKNASDNLSKSKKSEQDFSREKWIEKKFEDFCQVVSDAIDENGKYQLTDKVAIIGVEEDAFRYNGNWQIKTGHLMPFEFILEAYRKSVTTTEEFKQVDIINKTARNYRAGYYLKVIEKFTQYAGEMPNEYKEEPPLKKDFVLIIDEINRANLPSVLGELIYGLEYRGERIESMYGLEGGDASIVVPENLFIIGTMNTADRSVAHIDYAIRRRFAFVDILPEEGPINLDEAKRLYNSVKKLFVNEKGERSEHLAPDFEPKDVQIGHSYFITDSSKSEQEQRAQLDMKLRYEVIPILNEYIKDGLLLDSARTEINELGNA